MVAALMMNVHHFYLALADNASTSVLRTTLALETLSVSFKTGQTLLLHACVLKAWLPDLMVTVNQVRK